MVFPKIASYFAVSKRGKGSGSAASDTRIWTVDSRIKRRNGVQESSQVSPRLCREGDGHAHRRHPHRCHRLLALNLFGFQKYKESSVRSRRSNHSFKKFQKLECSENRIQLREEDVEDLQQEVPG